MTNVVPAPPTDPPNTLDGSSYAGSVGRSLQLFARFNTIITSLKALDKGFCNKNYVRKFLRALHPKWRAKVTAIEESKDLSSLALDKLIVNLKVHEVVMEKDFEIYRGKKERVKSIALKARKESSDDETSTSKSADEEYAMAVRNFKKFFRRKGKFIRQPREEKKSFRHRDDKKGKSERKCFRCDDPNYLIGDCPKPPHNKDQKAFIGGSWSDSENNVEDKTNDETCLMAQSSNEATLNSSYYSDNASSLDNDTMEIEYDSLCKISLKIIYKNKTLKTKRDLLEMEVLELNEKFKKLKRSKEIDIACKSCQELKLENARLKETQVKFIKFDKSANSLREMLNNQKLSSCKIGLGFDSSKASASETKLMSFVGSFAEKATDGSTIKVHGSTLPESVSRTDGEKVTKHVFSPPMSFGSDFVITRKKLIHNRIDESKKPFLKPSLKNEGFKFRQRIMKSGGLLQDKFRRCGGRLGGRSHGSDVEVVEWREKRGEWGCRELAGKPSTSATATWQLETLCCSFLFLFFSSDENSERRARLSEVCFGFAVMDYFPPLFFYCCFRLLVRSSGCIRSVSKDDGMVTNVLIRVMNEACSDRMAFVYELQSVPGEIVPVKTAVFFRGHDKQKGRPLIIELRYKADSSDWTYVLSNFCQEAADDNRMIATKLNKLRKAAEFVTDTLRKNDAQLTQLRKVERQMEFKALKKELFVQKLIGNVCFMHWLGQFSDEVVESLEIMKGMQLDDIEKASRLLLMAREVCACVNHPVLVACMILDVINGVVLALEFERVPRMPLSLSADSWVSADVFVVNMAHTEFKINFLKKKKKGRKEERKKEKIKIVKCYKGKFDLEDLFFTDYVDYFYGQLAMVHPFVFLCEFRTWTVGNFLRPVFIKNVNRPVAVPSLTVALKLYLLILIGNVFRIIEIITV
nr:zf-CCHC domain-containing protein/UBN2 domain-containing protein [Tanacetum cinerariifolium]